MWPSIQKSESEREICHEENSSQETYQNYKTNFFYFEIFNNISTCKLRPSSDETCSQTFSSLFFTARHLATRNISYISKEFFSINLLSRMCLRHLILKALKYLHEIKYRLFRKAQMRRVMKFVRRSYL